MEHQGQTTPNPQADPLLTVEQLADLLQITVDSVYNLTRSRAHGQAAPLPCIRISARALRFRRSSIEIWLQQHECLPAPAYKPRKRKNRTKKASAA